MMLSATDKQQLANLASRAFAVVDQLLAAYTQLGGVRHRFALGVYDASDPGAAFDPASIDGRVIADFVLVPDEWGERTPSATIRRKASGALGANARGGGAVLGEVEGKPVVVAGTGFVGAEDEAFADILLQAMKRLRGDYPLQSVWPRRAQ